MTTVQPPLVSFNFKGHTINTLDPDTNIRGIYHRELFKALKLISSQFDINLISSQFESSCPAKLVNEIEAEFFKKLELDN